MRAQRCVKQNFLFLTLRELCVSALIYDLPVVAAAAADGDGDGNMPLCKPQLLLMSRASSDELHNSDDT